MKKYFVAINFASALQVQTLFIYFINKLCAYFDAENFRSRVRVSEFANNKLGKNYFRFFFFEKCIENSAQLIIRFQANNKIH